MASIPRHSRSKNVGKQPVKTKDRPSMKGWAGLRRKDLEDLGEKMRNKFHWTHTPREFQLEAVKAQLLRKDVLVHAGTGSGKTSIAAGPHAVIEKSRGMVTLMVSPLIALQEEQVVTFREEFGLSAIAVNSVHGGCTKDITEKICSGEWQIVLISPEIILSSTFIADVLRNPNMAPRIVSVIVDEAHVVSHWGKDFRKDYGRLGSLRTHLPKGTPWVAMSATMSSRIRRDVLKKLEFNEREYISLDIGNDRTNVSLVVRSMHNTMNSYSDLDFAVSNGIKEPGDIPLTLIYSDGIDATGIESRLNGRCPPEMRSSGLIRPYSAAFSSEHRASLMTLFRAGSIRILICTDAAGMGCNVLNVDVVIQWKLPSTVSTFVQRAGRAARDPKRTGLAVLLVEKSTYEADLSKLEDASVSSAKKNKGVRQSSMYIKAPKGYALRHGVQRGSFNGLDDDILEKGAAPLDLNSLDEGLYTLVQTGACRRAVLTQIYGNKVSCEFSSNKKDHDNSQALPTVETAPSASCCDLCDPSLLDRTRPGPPEAAGSRKVSVKTGAVNEDVRSALEDWRLQIWTQDFEDALFGPSCILKDETIEILAAVGPVVNLKELERVVGIDWPWFGIYGDNLLSALIELDIPPVRPKVRPQRTEKRKAGEIHPEDENEDAARRPMKRTSTTRLAAPREDRAPVNKNPTPVSSGSVASRTPRVGFGPTQAILPSSSCLPHPTYAIPTSQYHYMTPGQAVNTPTHSNPYRALSSPSAFPLSYSHYQPYYYPPIYNYYQTPFPQPPAPNPSLSSSHPNLNNSESSNT